MQREQLGTIVSNLEGPSPSTVSFVINNGKAHKGMFAELEYSEGLMMLLVEDVIKTNRYFERPDSVKVMGEELEKNFPAAEWEFLIAKARPLGVFTDTLVNRPTFPPSPGTKVFVADNERIKKFLGLEEKGIDLGKLQFHDVELKLNLSKLLQKHLAIVATSGAGKCLSYSSRIQLADGSFEKIGKLVDNELEKGSIFADGVEYAINNNSSLKVFSLNLDNALVPSRINVFARRKAPGKLLSIKTRAGKYIECTPEHLIPTFNKSANIDWLPASELAVGDFSLSPRFSSAGENKTISLNKIQKRNGKDCPEKILIDTDSARFFAYVLAEGHNFGNGFSFSNSNKDVMKDYFYVCEKLVNEKPHFTKGEKESRVYNKVLATALKEIGFTSSSWTKFVAKEILQSSEEVITSFLGAFIDCDGHVSKKSVEVTLASVELIDAIESMYSRLGVNSHRHIKKVKGREYSQLIVSGAKNYQILNEKLFLRIDYKNAALNRLSSLNANTNVDVVPNLSAVLKEISSVISIHQPGFRALSNYFPRKDNPSFSSLEKWIGVCSTQILKLQTGIQSIKNVFFSLPNITEEEALCVVRENYGEFDFNEIAHNSGVSSTTARRVVRGITAPKVSTYKLAANCLRLKNQSDLGVEKILEVNIKENSRILQEFCKLAGIKMQELCANCGFSIQILNTWANNGNSFNYSNFYKLANSVYLHAINLEDKLPLIEKKLSYLKSIIDSGLFFDEITSISEIKSSSEYVYDLSIEHSNFISNGLLVHNSYFVSVLLEELLSRSREQGQIGIVVLDTHGEYTCFGEPVSKENAKSHIDFSSKTRIVDASKIKIACSKLSVFMVSSLISDVSPTQKRALGNILSKLNAEMRSGAGPFDLGAIRSEIEHVDNEKTAASLHAIVTDLEEMNLFGKIDEPSITDLVKPGQLVVIDLNSVISEKKKQFIVAYISNKLFNERRSHTKKIPPFALFVEEAHNFLPEGTAAEHAVARSYLRTIAREGRKFGASLVVISQRPKRLDTTTLANCNTHVILRITNPYDLDHISQSSEGLDKSSVGIISSLRVGEALIVGEAVHAPTFFKVRLRKSSPSRHESNLEDAAKAFYADELEKDDEINSFL
ncbi:MAG: DUF87 domain-containing protein [archaeon]